MKWLILLCCLLLCGCEAAPAPVQEAAPVIEEPAPPAVVEVPLRVLTPVELEIVEPPQWSGSDIQQGDPITPQPGDTSDSWDPKRAKEFPADDACAPMELLEKWMAVEGLSFEDLTQRECGQLLLIISDGGSKAKAFCYSLQKDGSWQAEETLRNMDGYTGSNGIAHDRRRGSKASPAGLWALTSAFGLEEAPEGLKLPWRDITPQSDWVTDARSIYFNTWQERDDPELTAGWRWSDTEHLEDFRETYTYACVIEYNTPPYTVPKRGCAIFLHVSDHPTTGCIGLLSEDMVRVLQWLDPYRSPHILITGKN